MASHADGEGAAAAAHKLKAQQAAALHQRHLIW